MLVDQVRPLFLWADVDLGDALKPRGGGGLVARVYKLFHVAECEGGDRIHPPRTSKVAQEAEKDWLEIAVEPAGLPDLAYLRHGLGRVSLYADHLIVAADVLSGSVRELVVRAPVQIAVLLDRSRLFASSAALQGGEHLVRRTTDQSSVSQACRTRNSPGARSGASRGLLL